MRLPKNKNPCVKRKDCLTPVSLCREREYLILSDSQRPDNGGVSGGTYWGYSLFGSQLPGPFTTCAAAPFPPARGSLELALVTTLPVHRLCIFIQLPATITQFFGFVKQNLVLQ